MDTPKRKGRFWPWFVLALLAVPLVGDSILIFMVSTDPSFAVEENYYEKALEWDQKQVQRARNQQLGWRVEPRFLPTAADGGLPLEVALVGRDGETLADARVRMRAFAHARPARVQEEVLHKVDAGVYATRIRSPRRGWWRLEFQVTRGDIRFTAVETVRMPLP